MDFLITEEEQAFKKEVTDFIDEVFREVLPSDWQGVDPGPEEEEREEVYPLAVEVWRRMGAKGWIGLGWPKEYGGQGDLSKDWILKEELTPIQDIQSVRQLVEEFRLIHRALKTIRQLLLSVNLTVIKNEGY